MKMPSLCSCLASKIPQSPLESPCDSDDGFTNISGGGSVRRGVKSKPSSQRKMGAAASNRLSPPSSHPPEDTSTQKGEAAIKSNVSIKEMLFGDTGAAGTGSKAPTATKGGLDAESIDAVLAGEGANNAVTANFKFDDRAEDAAASLSLSPQPSSAVLTPSRIPAAPVVGTNGITQVAKRSSPSAKAVKTTAKCNERSKRHIQQGSKAAAAASPASAAGASAKRPSLKPASSGSIAGSPSFVENAGLAQPERTTTKKKGKIPAVGLHAATPSPQPKKEMPRRVLPTQHPSKLANSAESSKKSVSRVSTPLAGAGTAAAPSPAVSAVSIPGTQPNKLNHGGFSSLSGRSAVTRLTPTGPSCIPYPYQPSDEDDEAAAEEQLTPAAFSVPTHIPDTPSSDNGRDLEVSSVNMAPVSGLKVPKPKVRASGALLYWV